MFDRSFLPDADLEFVVMTDTHYMLDRGGHQIEFASRRQQSARAAHALALVASLEPAFVVHLGDLIQEFPESEGFATSLGQALDQITTAGVQPRHVAGNHDVGDKPDPTMPTDWVSPATLAAYHERFGPSWYSWDAAGFHFIVLNSQIMNADLPATVKQQRWLEADLATNSGVASMIFLHLPPFLCHEHEPALGHYDNIDEPARSWLIGLCRRHAVRFLFAGHSHFAFFNRIGQTRSFVVPSTAFTRPGFGELFSSCPPPERGRDDTPKLGFFFVRAREGQARVHLIRTNGETTPLGGPASESRLVTRTSPELVQSPLGLTLRHALAPETEVPIAWQSTVRQPVRNDYPLLACVELGVRHVYVPAQDLGTARHRERLTYLRDEGIAITASWIWSSQQRIANVAAHHRDLLAGVEIQFPGHLQPDTACLQTLRTCSAELALPVTLSPLLPREIVPGKQHTRTRIGYHLDEIVALDRFLGERGVRVDRVRGRIDTGQRPWSVLHRALELPHLNQIGAIHWAIEFDGSDDQRQVSSAAEAMLGVALFPDSRLLLEPLIDFDRTMDIPRGLLDRLCNPRPAFHVVRILNTILFGQSHPWQPCKGPELPHTLSLGLQSPHRRFWLVVPARTSVSAVRITNENLLAFAPNAKMVRGVDLERGTIRTLDLQSSSPVTLDRASLMICDHDTEFNTD